ncbi:hypothetical protein ncot_17675 [Nocardioides sp. JQ2195]|uniref:hypothetical protein n=1 Tax=Nocardioides sp. JQ2195 TaxID=2592334 RepID=UPI00143ED84A|nr:hypothetical protein [Nocardioides sp. JQ2195]QIX28213.1 hypothetical protein ncot_17675 [Nocardioides sp. JQ2195]
MHDKLQHSIRATHDVLDERLSVAEFRRPTPARPRDVFPATDTFLASASRHLAAANAVLVPAIERHLAGGHDLARDFSRASRDLEQAMAQTKAKLYGEAHAIHRPWSEIWSDLHSRFNVFMDLEERMAQALVDSTSDGFCADLADRVYAAELHSPTRPHPFVPHRGVRGRVARRICLTVDHFWDATEGRMIPEPVKPHDRSHDGRFTQYLLADPHLPEEEA